MWNTIKERLKSKVVIIEILAAAAALGTAITGADYTNVLEVAKVVVAAVFTVFSLFAAANNPTTPNKF